MLRSAAIALIKQRLGNRPDMDAHILAEMQFVQATLLEGGATLPWFLLTEVATATTIAAEERLPVPSDFLREDAELGGLWRYDVTQDKPWIELKKDEYPVLKARYTTTGKPSHYALAGEYFRFFPLPDAAYQIKQVYLARGLPLTSDIENVWLKYAADWLIAETGKIIATYIQNTKIADLFEKDAMVAKNRVMVEDVARREAALTREMGDD